jgi:hypothetical protein
MESKVSHVLPLSKPLTPSLQRVYYLPTQHRLVLRFYSPNPSIEYPSIPAAIRKIQPEDLFKPTGFGPLEGSRALFYLHRMECETCPM